MGAEHDITFCKTLAAAKKYQETGYNSAFQKVYSSALRNKLIDDPDELEVKKLIKFTNQLKNRTPENTLPDLLVILQENTKRNAHLRDVCLDDDPSDDSKLEEVQRVFEDLCSVHSFGPTGASKFLGAILPKLCVMWDKDIRESCGERSSKKPRYDLFLQKVHCLALEVVQDAKLNHGIDDPARYISEQLGITPPFSLPLSSTTTYG